jgi:hypothetical protein
MSADFLLCFKICLGRVGPTATGALNKKSADMIDGK